MENDSSEKAVNRIFLLLWTLMMAVGAIFLVWRAYPAAVETWDYVVRLEFGISGYPFSGQLFDLVLRAGWLILILLCCSLCLDSAIRSTMKYIRNLKVDFQVEVPESEETVVEEKATEGAK